MRVLVVSKNNQPLMPMKQAKARKMLKTNLAKVISKQPFTIKLLIDVEENITPISCGIDDGAKYAGISFVMDKKKKQPECIFSGEIDVDTYLVKERMRKRADSRRTRRARLRYRKPRFDNRARKKCVVCGRNAQKGKQTCKDHLGSKPEVKIMKNYVLPPSSKARKDRIVRVVNHVEKFIPIHRIVIETGRFDLQKLVNPDLSVTDYQQGPLYERDSVKAALIFEYGINKEENRIKRRVPRCCYCEKDKGVVIEIEHIKPKAQGGTNTWRNLTLACRGCNEKKGDRTPKQAGMKLIIQPKHFHLTHVFKFASYLMQGKNYMENEFRKKGYHVDITYGQFTSWIRKSLEIEKTHVNDATIVAMTKYIPGFLPKKPLESNEKWEIKPVYNKARQIFNATHYSPNKGIPKGYSKHATVDFGYTLRTLTEVNKACVLYKDENGKLKTKAIKITESIPDHIELVVQKNDIVQVKRPKLGDLITARISSTMSNGSVKIETVNKEGKKVHVQVNLKNIQKKIERAKNIVFNKIVS